MLTIYFLRHGEVHNPAGIIYGHLPGFGLSETGRGQIVQAAALLAERMPIQALYASPLQRAQESASIVAERLDLRIATESLLVETGIGGYQGQTFDSLPQPYITELPTHGGIESAASIRQRLLAWGAQMQDKHDGQQIIAVSHRDAIIVALLHWMEKDLADLPQFPLSTGGLFEVRLEQVEVEVERLI